MDNTTAGYFLIWLTHLIWHVVLLFCKLSFLLLSIPILYLSGCGLPSQIISGILFIGLILIVFSPFKSPFNPHEHRLCVINLYKALEAQLFREMCPPIIDNNYQETFKASIMNNYSIESILLFCIYKNVSKKEINHEQYVKSFLNYDNLDEKDQNCLEKQKHDVLRNIHDCLPEIRVQKVVYNNNNDDAYNNNTNNNNDNNNNDDEKLQSIDSCSNNDKNCIKNRDEHSEEEIKIVDTDVINKNLVEEKAFEQNGICSAISEISHDKIIDNLRKFDANESIPECVELVEKVIAVINADSLSDDMENYGKLENCSKEVRDEDLIAVINVFQSDSDST